MLRKAEGRVWGDIFTSQGMPKIDTKLPEARGEAWNFLTVLEETNLVNTSVLDFNPPELCFSSPSKQIYLGRVIL